MLVVAAAGHGAVEARLRPQLGQLLCVVASRCTRAEINAVRAHLDERWEEWNLYELGESNGQAGQAYTAAKLTRVLPEIPEWAASLPPGILALDPWLRPNAEGPGSAHGAFRAASLTGSRAPRWLLVAGALAFGDDDRAPALDSAHEPLGLQQVERLGRGRLGAAPVLGDPVDRRQRVARPQLAALDPLPQVGGDAQVRRVPGPLLIARHMINAS